MLRARSPLLNFRVFPPHPASFPARVIRGAFTGVVQSYLTFSIKLLTFSGLTCAITYILAKVAQKCKTCSSLPELQKIETQEVL